MDGPGPIRGEATHRKELSLSLRPGSGQYWVTDMAIPTRAPPTCKSVESIGAPACRAACKQHHQQRRR
jgi:hypothetical protein